MDHPYLSGPYAPIDTEIDVTLEVVEGEVPRDLFGAYVRNGPNPKRAPLGAHHWFDGDGMLHAVHAEDGTLRYRNRFVSTEATRREDEAGAQRLLIGGGGITLLLAELAAMDIWGAGTFETRGAPVFSSFLGALLYAAFGTLMLGLFMALTRRWNRLGAIPRGIAQALIVTGGLALPIFAFHEVVIPTKDMLLLAGLPGLVALALPLGAFLLGIGYAWRRLFRMYFR